MFYYLTLEIKNFSIITISEGNYNHSYSTSKARNHFNGLVESLIIKRISVIGG